MKENPQWVACRRALGREPIAIEYISWCNRQIEAFCAANGIRRDRFGMVDRARFLTWLEEA